MEYFNLHEAKPSIGSAIRQVCGYFMNVHVTATKI